MKRAVYFLLFFCVLNACSSADDVPSNILQPEKMKLVLFDVLRAQEIASLRYGLDTNELNTNMPVMLQQVLQIHKITKEDFYNSFTYYEAHPDKNRDLFDSLGAYTDRAKQDFYRVPVPVKTPMKTPKLAR